MNYTGIKLQILAILNEGPATSEEIEAETGKPVKSLKIHLWQLKQAGYVTHDGKRVRTEGKRGSGCVIWEITV